MTESESRIVVGIVPGQPAAVVATAASFAERFDAELVCAYVDTVRYGIGADLDGAVVALPIEADLAAEVVEMVDSELRAAVAAALEGRSVRWSIRALAGAPALELGRLAEEVDATMIVVGTREPGIRGSLHEFFNGSVAAQLTHRQRRPVLVVPLRPVGEEGELPWEDAGS